MEHEETSATERRTSPTQSKAGVLSYIAKEYQAVEALADPDDPAARAYLGRLGKILDAAEAGKAADC